MAWVGRVVWVVGVGSRFVVFRNNARFLITSQRPDCPAISHSFAQKLESPGPDRHFFALIAPLFSLVCATVLEAPGSYFDPNCFLSHFGFSLQGHTIEWPKT